MLVKELVNDLEKGDRTREMLVVKEAVGLDRFFVDPSIFLRTATEQMMRQQANPFNAFGSLQSLLGGR